VKGLKPILARFDKLGSALGDARDLSLLRDYLNKAQDKHPLPMTQQRSLHVLLTYIDQQCTDLHGRARKVAQRVYRYGKKKFLRWVKKRWCRWQGTG
jgi:CHAD domain-containing protein